MIFFTFLNSFVFIIFGVYRSIKGYYGLIEQLINNNVQTPGVILAESLDSFLIAIVFIIFSLGMYKLFILNGNDNGRSRLPEWLEINNLSDLKFLLWETFIITLIILTMTTIIESMPHLGWNALILPAIILILSIGIFVVKKSNK